MRTWTMWSYVVIAVVACGKKTDQSATTGSGSAAGSGSVNVATIDAAADPDVDAAVVSVDPTKLISSDGVGSITQKTAPKLAGLKRLVPSLHWHTHETESGGEDVKVFDGRTGKDPAADTVLRVVPSGGSVAVIHAFKAGFMTAAGIEAGNTGEALAKAYPDLSCELESGVADDLVCTSGSLPKIRFSLEMPTGFEADKITVPQVAALKIKAIYWTAAGE